MKLSFGNWSAPRWSMSAGISTICTLRSGQRFWWNRIADSAHSQGSVRRGFGKSNDRTIQTSWCVRTRRKLPICPLHTRILISDVEQNNEENREKCRTRRRKGAICHRTEVSRQEPHGELNHSCKASTHPIRPSALQTGVNDSIFLSKSVFFPQDGRLLKKLTQTVVNRGRESLFDSSSRRRRRLTKEKSRQTFDCFLVIICGTKWCVRGRTE